MKSELFMALDECNPINKALYLMTTMPALQLFIDGNKRTSRMCAMHTLMHSDILPFSIVNIDKDKYLWSLIVFYETGDTQPIRDIMLDGWAHSLMRSGQVDDVVSFADNYQETHSSVLKYLDCSVTSMDEDVISIIGL